MEAASITPSPPGKSLGKVLSDNLLWFLFGAALLLLAVVDLTGDKGDLTPLGNNIKDGISVGTIWALIALGYTIVYGIIELINFAHGEVFMIGSFITVSLFVALGVVEGTSLIGMVLGIFVVLIVAMIGCALLNSM